MVPDRATSDHGNDGDTGASGSGGCTGWDSSECTGTPHCPPRCPRFFDRTGTPLLIRPLRAGDRASVVEMYEAIESTTLGLPPDRRDRLVEWLSDIRERGWNLVAIDGERVVGHIGVVPEDAAAPEIVVFVHEAYHDRGIGTELVKQAIAHAADRDHERLTLTVERRNRRAIAVYSNVGFERVDGRGDLEMALSLDAPVTEAVQQPPADRED